MEIYRVKEKERNDEYYNDFKSVYFEKLESALNYVYTEYIKELGNCKVNFDRGVENIDYDRDIMNNYDYGHDIIRVCSFKLDYDKSDYWNGREIIIDRIRPYERDKSYY